MGRLCRTPLNLLVGRLGLFTGRVDFAKLFSLHRSITLITLSQFCILETESVVPFYLDHFIDFSLLSLSPRSNSCNINLPVLQRYLYFIEP
jgi:hypothetical protein